jgi:hypothetical protein
MTQTRRDVKPELCAQSSKLLQSTPWIFRRRDFLFPAEFFRATGRKYVLRFPQVDFERQFRQQGGGIRQALEHVQIFRRFEKFIAQPVEMFFDGERQRIRFQGGLGRPRLGEQAFDAFGIEMAVFKLLAQFGVQTNSVAGASEFNGGTWMSLRKRVSGA